MKFKCTVCGYIHDGNSAPEVCPKCGAPKEKIEQIANEAAQLIDRARKTNLLYAKLTAILAEAEILVAEGIEDNLDPGCLKIFTSAEEQIKVLQQKIKAELATHMQKGKWG